MLASLLFALTLRPAPLIEMGAARLDTAIAKIGDITGQSLRCDDQFLDDYLVLRWKDEPGQEMLDAIARAVDGRWVAADGGRRLVVDELRQKARRDAERAAAVAHFKKALDDIKLAERYDSFAVLEMNKQLAALSAITDAGERTSKMLAFAPNSPTGRFQTRFARLLGAEKIADQPVGTTVVYSSSPTRLQSRIPEGGMDVVRQFMTEAKMVMALQKELPSSLSNQFQLAELVHMGAASYGEFSTALVKVVRSQQSVSIRLQTFSKDGKPAFSDMISREIPDNWGGLPEPQLPKEIMELPGEIEFSDDAINWGQMITPYQAKPIPLMPGVIKALTSDEGRDLLGFGASEILLETARQLDKSMVAVVPDEASFLPWSGDERRIPVASMAAMLFGMTNMQATLDARWLMVKPANLDRSRTGRIPRAELRILGRAVVESDEKELPLEPTLNLLAACPEDFLAWVSLQMISPLLGETERMQKTVGRLEPLFIAARLSAPQRRQLLQEGIVEIPYDSLPETTKPTADFYLTSGWLFADLQKPDSRPAQWDEAPQTDYIFSPESESILQEPTVLLAQPNTPLTLRLRYQLMDVFDQSSGSGDDIDIQTITLRGIAKREVQIRRKVEGEKHMLYAHEPIAAFSVSFLAGQRYELFDSSFIALRPGLNRFIGLSEFSGDLKKHYEQMLQEELKKPAE